MKSKLLTLFIFLTLVFSFFSYETNAMSVCRGQILTQDGPDCIDEPYIRDIPDLTPPGGTCTTTVTACTLSSAQTCSITNNCESGYLPKAAQATALECIRCAPAKYTSYKDCIDLGDTCGDDPEDFLVDCVQKYYCPSSSCTCLKANGQVCSSKSECYNNNCVDAYNEAGQKTGETKCCSKGYDYYDEWKDGGTCRDFGAYTNICNLDGTCNAVNHECVNNRCQEKSAALKGDCETASSASECESGILGYSCPSDGQPCVKNVCVPETNKYCEASGEVSYFRRIGMVCGNDDDNPTAPGTSCVGANTRYCTYLNDASTRRCCENGQVWTALGCKSSLTECSIVAPNPGFDTTACQKSTEICCSSQYLDQYKDLEGLNKACVLESIYKTVEDSRVKLCGKWYNCGTDDGVCPDDYGSSCDYDPDCRTCAGTDTECGYTSCTNCNSLDGCSGNYLVDYYCGGARSLVCQSNPTDDCSDCSCTCGNYNQPESSYCKDWKDNDCNGESDYDTLDGRHGDVACKVEVTKIEVDNSNPTANSNILVMCTTNTNNINSIEATISGQTCTFMEAMGTNGWIGNTAYFSCSTGAIGTKSVACSVNTQKSYQQGTDKTKQITVKADDSFCAALTQSECNSNSECQYCEICNGKQARVGGEACISAESDCGTYTCIPGTCGAVYNADDGCPANNCQGNTLESYEFSSEQCDCVQTTQQCQGQQKCEDLTQNNEFHITGSCDSECLNGQCTECNIDMETDCDCLPSWFDQDGSKATNGCEIQCSDIDCCGDNFDNDCDGIIDGNSTDICDKDKDGFVGCEEVADEKSLIMCPGMEKTCKSVTEEESQELVLDLAKYYCENFDENYPEVPEKTLCKWLLCNHLTPSDVQKEEVCESFCESNEDLCRSFCQKNTGACDSENQ